MLELIIGFVVGFVVCQIWTIIKIARAVKSGKVNIKN